MSAFCCPFLQVPCFSDCFAIDIWINYYSPSEQELFFYYVAESFILKKLAYIKNYSMCAFCCGILLDYSEDVEEPL